MENEDDDVVLHLRNETMKANFAEHRHGGLNMLRELDMERFHIVIPGRDDTEGIDTESIENRKIYESCSAVARDLRLADTTEIGDGELVDEIKKEIADDSDLQFYVTYLLLTEVYEYEQEQGIEFSNLSDSLGKYLLKVLVERIKDSDNVRDFEIIRDIVTRMTRDLPLSFSGATYFGIGEYDDIWSVASSRERELVEEPGFNKIFRELRVVDEKVVNYKKDHEIDLKK